MMDKAIHKTLDNRESLTEKVEKDLEKGFRSLDLKEVLSSPEEVLTDFVEELADQLLDRYMVAYMQEGRRFAREVMSKRKPVEIQPGSDPNLNKDEVQGGGESGS